MRRRTESLVSVGFYRRMICCLRTRQNPLFLFYFLWLQLINYYSQVIIIIIIINNYWTGAFGIVILLQIIQLSPMLRLLWTYFGSGRNKHKEFFFFFFHLIIPSFSLIISEKTLLSFISQFSFLVCACMAVC